MPSHKDLKRRVRARVVKTGESYTAARTQVLRKKQTTRKARGATGTRAESGAARSATAPSARSAPSGATAAATRGKPRARTAVTDLAQIAGLRDDAVRAKTGRDWAGWVAALDAHRAFELPHPDIARLLAERFEVPGWWSQMVAVGYERIRGLRAKGQRRGGGFDVNKSKTVHVPIAALYRAFGARARRRWLGDVALRVKTATANKSMRLTWDDGTPVDVYFVGKGAGKSTVAIQHRDLPDAAAAARVRTAWGQRLDALAALLSGAR